MAETVLTDAAGKVTIKLCRSYAAVGALASDHRPA